MAKLVTFLFIFATLLMISPALSLPLRIGFYQKTCPSAESIVRSSVKTAFVSDPGAAGALVRLHFHDCFVRGCDASILLDSTPGNQAEKDSMGNKAIHGFEIIDEAKAKIEARCHNIVSCSDILAFAARDSVTLTGGLYYDVPSGRRDGRISSIAEVTRNLPNPFFNVTQLKENFARKGLSMEEMVTLSGAHSIGDSHCSSFSKHLYSFNKTFAQDPSMDPDYASFLKTICPRQINTTNSSDPSVPLDPVTPNRVDNNYYKNLMSNKGLLASDQVLWNSVLTRKFVKENVNHPRTWAAKFVAAMVHMGSIDVLTGKQGEIRKNCRVVN